MRFLVVIFWWCVLASVYAGGSMPATGSDVFLRSGPLAISKEGYNLIINYEVGGGPSYYNRYLQRPTWPGGASGVTIGIGYDLGYNTKAQIASDWRELPADTIARLQSVAGLKGSEAKYRLKTVSSILIPWGVAEKVYKERTIPRFATITERSYQGTSTLHPHVQGAMLSWVFNRGGGISSSSRDREKRNIRSFIPSQVRKLPAEFRASKRLWVGKGLDGLLSRREAEARLIESSL